MIFLRQVGWFEFHHMFLSWNSSRPQVATRLVVCIMSPARWALREVLWRKRWADPSDFMAGFRVGHVPMVDCLAKIWMKEAGVAGIHWKSVGFVVLPKVQLSRMSTMLEVVNFRGIVVVPMVFWCR